MGRTAELQNYPQFDLIVFLFMKSRKETHQSLCYNQPAKRSHVAFMYFHQAKDILQTENLIYSSNTT